MIYLNSCVAGSVERLEDKEGRTTLETLELQLCKSRDTDHASKNLRDLQTETAMCVTFLCEEIQKLKAEIATLKGDDE